MKTATSIIGYITAFAIMVAAVFKFEHFSGAGTALMLTGFLLSIYFPVFVIDKMSDFTEGKILPSIIAAALSASLISLGITFRLWHWTGAAALLILGLGGFSLIFIPMQWAQKRKGAGTDNIMTGAGALGLSTFALGILFKLQHWTGAPILLAAGPAFLFLIYFPKYIIDPSVDKDKKSRYLRNSFFVIIIGTICALYFKKSIEIHDMDNHTQLTVSAEPPGTSPNP